MLANLQIEKISTSCEFGLLSKEWNSLLRRSKADSIFLSFEWISSWINNYLKNDHLHILIVKHNQRMVGIAPLYIHFEKHYGVKIRVLRFLGDHSVGSIYLDFIVEKGLEDVVLEKLYQYFDAHKKEYNLIQLKEISSKTNLKQQLQQLAEKFNFRISYDSKTCSQVVLPTTWEEYLKRFKRNHRRAFRLKRRKLAKDHKFVFYQANIQTNTHDILKTLFTLHQKRWVTKGHPGTFSDICKRNFYFQFVQSVKDLNWIRVYCLEVEGQIIAIHFGLFYDNRLLNLQEGFDPDWMKFGASNILRGLVIEELISEGVESYEFLRGKSYHKRSWKAVEGNTDHLTFYQWSDLKSLVYILYSSLKRLAKRNIPTSQMDRIKSKQEAKQTARINRSKDQYLNLDQLYTETPEKKDLGIPEDQLEDIST